MNALALISGLVFLFLSYFFPVETEDVWWHLSVGRWILEHGQVPHFDPFPFGAERLSWTGHNEWLGSTALFLVFKLGGLLGLKIFRSICLIAACVIFFRYSRVKSPFPLCLLLSLLMAQCLFERTFLRPELFNLLFIQFFLIVLFAYERTKESKYLFVLPLLGAVWFNLHMGSVVYGIVLISTFLLSAVVARSYKDARCLTLALLGYLASFCVNPYGFEGFLYPFKVILLPNFIDFYKISDLIAENQGPGHIFMSWRHFHILLMFFLGVIALVLEKKNKFLSIILFLIPLFLFLMFARNVGFFTIVTGYLIVNVLAQLDVVGSWARWRYAKVIGRSLVCVLTAFFIWKAYVLSGFQVHYHGQTKNALSVESNYFSQAAIDFLKEHKMQGGVFNADILGNQIIFQGYPKLRPLVDGRFIDKFRFNDFRMVLENPQQLWSLAVQVYDLRIAVLNAGDEPYYGLIQYLETLPDWQLVSIQGSLVIYVKRGVFALSEELVRFQDNLRAIPALPGDIRKIQELTERPAMIFGRAIIRVDFLTTMKTLMVLGYKGAAIKELIRALEISNQDRIRQVALSVLKELAKE